MGRRTGRLQERSNNVHVDITIEAVEILLQVLFAVLEYQYELLFAVQYVVQTDDILVFQLFQQAYFSQGGGRYSLYNERAISAQATE